MLNYVVRNRTFLTFNCVFVFDRNKWNHLTVWKKWAQGCLKNINHIIDIYVYKEFGIKWPAMVDMP